MIMDNQAFGKPAVKDREISILLEELGKVCSVHRSEVEVLTARLEKVLSQKQTKGNVDANLAPGRAVVTEIGAALNSRVQDVYVCTRAIQDILERLEL